MIRADSSNLRTTFSCVPKEARTVAKTPDERLTLIKERVGTIVRDCDFSEGRVFLPNPVKHTDSVDVVNLADPQFWGWSDAVRDGNLSFMERKSVGSDSWHRDSIVLFSEKPLEENVGIFFAPADCAIVWLAHKDPDTNFAALIHSWWKGTAKGIIGNTVDAVKEIFWNGVTKDLEAYVSPFAKRCCYEFGVGDFYHAFKEGKIMETDGRTGLFVPLWIKLRMLSGFWLHSRDHKTYLDTSALIHQSLEAAEIPDERTNDLSICTICEGHEIGYSSSRKNPNSRFWVFLSLKAEKNG